MLNEKWDERTQSCILPISNAQEEMNINIIPVEQGDATIRKCTEDDDYYGVSQFLSKSLFWPGDFVTGSSLSMKHYQDLEFTLLLTSIFELILSRQHVGWGLEQVPQENEIQSYLEQYDCYATQCILLSISEQTGLMYVTPEASTCSYYQTNYMAETYTT
ncbi:hypothetical protein H5410_004121 [Solanum commersonii]|uniref:Uncharacterized protein n=1 Tax=Solanum commersonii TaxID=4109 RepID=A0A9J6B772_SOLCO|nr:hypothetical protein H5410_004121 [Solanum commersonii]